MATLDRERSRLCRLPAPLSQGRVALQALYQFLVDGTCPPPRIKVVPHVVMRSNLDLFLERLPNLEGVEQP